jgi:phage-related protein
MIRILNDEKKNLLTLSRKYNKEIQQYQDIRGKRKSSKTLEEIDAKIEGYKNQLLLAAKDISFIDNELRKLI